MKCYYKRLPSNKITNLHKIRENNNAMNPITIPPQSISKAATNKKLNSALYSIPIDKQDANQLQNELQTPNFQKWNEHGEAMSSEGIELKNIHKYIDHLYDAYEGIDRNVRQDMHAQCWERDDWSCKVWEFKTTNDGKIKYVMIGFEKTSNTSINCMYSLYKVEFEVKNQKGLPLKGLIEWNPTEKDKKPSINNINRRIKNFFRYKAMQNFLTEGIITAINFIQPVITERSTRKRNTETKCDDDKGKKMTTQTNNPKTEQKKSVFRFFKR